MQYFTFVAAAALLAGWVAISLLKQYKSAKDNSLQSPRFPGPRLLPFIGRIHDLPIQYMWVTALNMLCSVMH